MFWPATAAAAPINPTDVQVISENNSPYDTANAACAAALCASDPMNDSMRTPPMFIAIPWIPVGRPKRNNSRMIVQSGPSPRPRGNATTQPPAHSFHSAYAATSPPLMHVPIAEPRVPNDGIGPSPRMSTMFNRRFKTVIAMPRIIGVRASPAERNARTPMILGIAMTAVDVLLSIVLIGGLVAAYALWKLWAGGWVVAFPRGRGLGPDWTIIRELFRFGLPTGIQGIAMNIGGVLMLSFIGSLA